MIRFRKSSLVRGGLLTAIVLSMAVTLAGIAFAAGGVTIDTGVTTPNMPVYYDADKDGVNEPGELMGNYDAYDLAGGLHFHWSPVEGATHYRVSMIQYTPPNVGPGDPKTEIKVAHHSISDPNGLQFIINSLGVGEPVCLYCVTEIVVIPETAAVVQGEDGSNQVVYTQMPGKMVSKQFVIIGLPRGPEGGCRAGWTVFCADVTDNPEDYQDCLSDYAIARATGFCQACGPENDWCTDQCACEG
jgi:hypothetical protein